MRPVRRGAVLALALAVLAACQPPPRPFAPAERDGRAPVAPAQDAFGVTLRPVSGMAPGMAAAFAAAVVAALERRAVPSVVSTGRARGSLVLGTAQASPIGGERLEIGIEWWVFGRDGRGLGRHRVSAEAPRRDWEGASAAPIERLAADSADGISALLRPAVPVRRSRGPAIRMGELATPPGIDGEILRRAMVDAMRDARIGVSTGGRSLPRLSAAVSLGPVSQGRRRLGVEWRLDGAGGRRIGALVQENDVVNEALIADWPATARLIARAAVDDLRALLDRAAPVPSPPVDGPSGRP